MGPTLGSEAKARLGLWFLLGVALFAFNQLFETGDYPGPALLGMLMATGIAVGARRLGLGTLPTLAISTLVLLWYVSLIFQARHTFWSLPTPDSLEALWGSLERALDHSKRDYAPIPIRPGYAVLVVAAMWLATTIGELATFRWRRPLAASLMPIVIFAFALTVGTGTAGPAFVAAFMAALLTYWGLESAHRLRSWGRWVSAWTHHKDAEPDTITGELARRLGAAAIMCAVISPVFLPALEDGLLSWRSGLGDGPGGGSGGGGRLSPWVSIVPDIPTQTDAELFTVEAAEAAYWRISSLELFDGRNWREAERGRVDSDSGVIGGPLTPITVGEPLVQTVTVAGLEGEFLPAAVSPLQVARLDDEGSPNFDGIDYDPDSGAVLLDDDLSEGDRFQIGSRIPRIGYDDLRGANPGERGDIDDAFFTLEDALPQEARSLIERWIQEAETPFQELVAIQEQLRSFGYTVDPQLPQGESAVADFLLNTREGFCQQFATAFAVIARDLGYPSRVSVGFLPGSRDDLTDTYTVRGTDAHAWPEVWFRTYGWIAFEPTPRAESSAPRYTLPPVDGEGNGEGDGAEDLDFNNPFSDSQPGGTQNEPGGVLDDPNAPGGGEGRFENLPVEGEDGPRGTPAWQKTFARLILLGSIFALAFLAFMPAIKEMRIRRRYAEASGPDQTAAAAFAHFTDEAAELGSARRPSESASSYASRLAGSRQVTDRTALRLAQIYEAAAFAASDISSEQAEEAKRLARALRSQLWSQASWWARAARLFSPRRLTARSGV